MTAHEGRKLNADLAEVRARLQKYPDADREREIAELARGFDEAKARWAKSNDASAVAERLDAAVAALETRMEHLEEAIRRQSQVRSEASGLFEKRVAALEQTDAALAEKTGLYLPDDKDELWRQGTALLTSGERDRGRRYCQAFVDRFPQDPRASQAYLAIGRSYIDDARYSNAAATLQRLLSLYPASPEAPQAMWQLSRAFEELSFCSDARTLLRDLVGRFPKSPEAAEAAKHLRAVAQPSGECVS
jgi:TolA-binding protein